MITVLIVKIGAKEITCIVRRKCINANGIWKTTFVHAAQMLFYLRITQGRELTIMTIGTLAFFSYYK